MNTAFVVATKAAARAYSTLKGSLAIVGLAALAAFFVLPHQRQALLNHLPALSMLGLAGDPFAATTSTGSIQAGAAESALEREQRSVTEYIAKRYRVSGEAVSGFVATAYRAGAQHSVDPLLILAVMAIESRYNPVAESVMGAKGLMQVIPKYHLEKLMDHGGEQALLDPEVNIAVGAQILREYSRRFGDVEAALQMYAGALDEPSSQYANTVLAERARLEVLRQKAKKQQNA
jgi:soluble lytic murein transglycosylase-like protein